MREMRELSFSDLKNSSNDEFLKVINKLNGIAYDVWASIFPVNKEDKRFEKKEEIQYQKINQAAYDIMNEYNEELQNFKYKGNFPMKPLSAIEMGAFMAFFHGAGNCDLISHVTNLKILHQLDFRPFNKLETDVLLEREPANHSYVRVRLYTTLDGEPAVYTCVVDPWAVEATLNAGNFKGVATSSKYFLPTTLDNCDIEQSNRKTSMDKGEMIAVKMNLESQAETTYFKGKKIKQYDCHPDFFERLYILFSKKQNKSPSIFNTYDQLVKKAKIQKSSYYDNQSLVAEPEINSVCSLSPDEQLEREKEMEFFSRSLTNAVPFFKGEVSKYKSALDKMEEESALDKMEEDTNTSTSGRSNRSK